MHPSSILSYYPTYSILDEIVSYNNYKTLNIYIDLKNCLQSLYMEHAIVNIIESTIKSNTTDSSIFSSLISFLGFHKIYALKRNVNVNFIIFFETGVSYYHKNISKKYKISRKIDDLYGLEKEKRDLFFDVMHKNLRLIERACNKFPNTHVICLPHFEADFIPYYLISRELVSKTSDTAHVVYSNDHDLMQTLCAGDHVYIYQKVSRKKRIAKKGQVVSLELRKDGSWPDTLQPLAMAVIGDPGDDVDGVKTIGPGRFSLLLDDLLKILPGWNGTDLNSLYDDIRSKKPIFNLTDYRNSNKYLNKVIEKEQTENLISNNLRLVSFELLSREIDDPNSVEIVKLKDIINDAILSHKTVSMESMKLAIRKLNVTIEDDDLNTIYYKT